MSNFQGTNRFEMAQRTWSLDLMLQPQQHSAEHPTSHQLTAEVLEDVCKKQGFPPTDYDLKHHNHILDLTSTIRFSNLPNKAMLEMVEAGRKREESNVTIGLSLEDGERRTADFPPSTTLYDVVTSLAEKEFNTLQSPTILYTRQEVTGEVALKEKTLRQLGLIGGRAILRLLNKAEEPRQANVSAVYRRPLPEKSDAIEASGMKRNKDEPAMYEDPVAGPSDIHKNIENKTFDPIKLIKSVKNTDYEAKDVINDRTTESTSLGDQSADVLNTEIPMEVDKNELPLQPSSSRSVVSTTSLGTQENLERRLRIEEEVTFIGAQKAIAYMQPDQLENELEDLPDDFYDLTIEEVRKIYHELQQSRMVLENTPLMTSSKREEISKQSSEQKLSMYKNAVVRVQFPDRIILQGIFSPSNTIEDVVNFIKCHLQNPEKPFHIFTTPLKENLDPKMTLSDAKCVPCVHMHFKWLDEDVGQEPCLKEEIYLKQSTSDAASILASKYRAPSRKKIENASDRSQKTTKELSASKNKVPKWFK